MSFFRSFKYALSGIAYCVLCERNMRIHTVISLYVLFFSQFYDFSSIQYLIIALTIAAVMSAEMINTAFEKVCDKVTMQKNLTIKIVKDIAAGAVLVNAIAALVIGSVLFFHVDKILIAYEYFIHSWVRCAIFLLSCIMSIVFVVSAKFHKKKFEHVFKSREENFEKD